MIKQFDHVAEFVKQRHKMSAEKLGGSLDMRTVIAKQKALGEERKQAKLRVILSRKLKLKLQMMLNVSTKPQKQLQQSSLADRSSSSINRSLSSIDQSSTRLQKSRQLQHLRQQSSSLHFTRKFSFSSSILPRSSTLNTHKSSLSSSQLGGEINLFEKLSEAELQAIESDQGYYFNTPEHFELFQRFMFKKRLNSKDSSYQKFTLKHSRKYLQFGYEPIADPKQYIIDTLGISTHLHPPHLLTNPHFEQHLSHSKPLLPQFQQREKRLFEEFKQKQQSNRERLSKERENKKLGVRIEINYKSGLAAEKRAVFSDRKLQKVVEKNNLEDIKSKQRRTRLKTLLFEHGSSVDMAERIRQEMLKRRTQHADKRPKQH